MTWEGERDALMEENEVFTAGCSHVAGMDFFQITD